MRIIPINKNTEQTVTIERVGRKETFPLAETDEMKEAYRRFKDIRYRLSSEEIKKEQLNESQRAIYKKLWQKSLGVWPKLHTILNLEDDTLSIGYICDRVDKDEREYFIYATPDSTQAMQINIKEHRYMSYEEMCDYCDSKKDADGFCRVCNSCSGPCQSNLASDYPCPENVKRYRGGHWGGCFFEVWVGDEQ